MDNVCNTEINIDDMPISIKEAYEDYCSTLNYD
jgi:hypothetical protein